MELWLALIGTALVISGILTAIGRLSTSLDKLFLWNLMSDYTGNFWLALKANFGGKPSSPPNCATSRWFSVGICKYKPGYKSHDLL